MKVVIAMDSFKGSLRAVEACQAVGRGLRDVRPSLDLELRPMADGGEGTAETLIAAGGGRWVPQRVMGPLPDMEVEAGYAWLPEAGPGALVEMAAASGLDLLPSHLLNPLATTTYGTGQLLRAASNRGASRLWLAIGGSATVDGGVGAATALGWGFHDIEGKPVGLGGAALERIASIARPAPDDRPFPALEVLCDVDNPLLGERGAARVFGPQKGASPDIVERLERGMAHLADVIEEQLHVDVRMLPGSGAAGGLGAGAVAFMGARLVSGVDAVMKANGMAEAMNDADWVVTGEGRFDHQSLHGKVVSGISRLASQAGAQVAVIAGSVDVSVEEARSMGIQAVVSSAPESMPTTAAMQQARALLEAAARSFARSNLRG